MTTEPNPPALVRKQLFARAAAAFATDPRCVASCLTRYRAAHALAEPDLATWLGLPSVETLHGLALCQRPDPTRTTFAADVRALATYVGCDATRLRQVLTTCADQ